MDRVWASSLVEGLEINAAFQVRSRQLRTHRSGSGNYLTLVLGDRTGDVLAVAWDDADRFSQFAREGEVVFVRGHCQLYNGEVQIVVEHMSQATASDYTLSDFLPASARPSASMVREFRSEVNSVRQRGLRSLLESIFDRERFADFALAPAAHQVHHAYLGGLLEHTLEVARLCHTEIAIRPELDADLLITGALLHDVGKIREFTIATGFEQTDEGGLLGHIAIADALIVQHAARIPELPPELFLRLRHMLLSHHGRHEWQSPQLPKTLEAAALHMADYASSQLAIFAAARSQVERPGNWTPYQRALDRRVYVPPRSATPVPASLREPDDVPYASGDADAAAVEWSSPPGPR